MEEMKIDINCTFRIIPFSDSLWRAVFPQLKKQLGIEQINIVESKCSVQYLSIITMYMWIKL